MNDKILNECEHLPFTDTELKALKRASNILEKRIRDLDAFSSPNLVRRYLSFKLAHEPREKFLVMYLDNRHRLIQTVEHAVGDVSGCAVYPAIVIRDALKFNSPSLILSHQHPSSMTIFSDADIRITKKISEAAAIFDIKVLDHILVGNSETVSMAEKGLM